MVEQFPIRQMNWPRLEHKAALDLVPADIRWQRGSKVLQANAYKQHWCRQTHMFSRLFKKDAFFELHKQRSYILVMNTFV